MCEDNTKSASCCPTTCAPSCGAAKPIPHEAHHVDVKHVEKKEVKKEEKDLKVKKS